MNYKDIIKAISLQVQRTHDRQVIGKCSICGGLVAVPQIWGGIKPPIPTCANCGAEAKQPDPYKHLPTIPMDGGSSARHEIGSCSDSLSDRIDHWIKVFGDRSEARKKVHGGSC